MEGIKTDIVNLLYGDDKTGFIKYGRTYHGFRDIHKNPFVTYTLEGSFSALLSPEDSWVVNKHSPDGFEWGYRGSGPAQLALALLLEHYRNGVPEKYYQEVKSILIGALPEDGWSMDETEIRDTVEEVKEKLKNEG